MNRKHYLAGFLILPFGLAELCESGEPQPLAVSRSLVGQTASSATLASNPHTHFELDTNVHATTAVSISTSGSQNADESFRLHVVPEKSGFRLIGYPFGGQEIYDLYKSASLIGPLASRLKLPQPQLMYGFCGDIDLLMELLSSRLALPQPQLQAIQRTALEGVVQEIGGYSHSAIRLFRRGDLERLGMTFRPPDL